jgi:Leucine Rich repeat
LNHLPFVNFIGCIELNNEHVSQMTALRLTQGVTRVALSGCTQLHAHSLSALSQLTAMQSLDLSMDCQAECDAQLLRSTVAGFRRLQRLYLYRSALGDHGAKQLAQVLPRMTTLTWLAFTGSHCSNSAVALLGALSKLTSLQVLEFNGNAVGMAEARAFAMSVRQLVRLTTLSTDHTQYRPHSVQTSLSDTGIGEAAAETLVPALSHLTALQALNLADNGLGAAAAPAHARALPKLACLTTLSLGGNGIGGAAADEMLRALAHLGAAGVGPAQQRPWRTISDGACETVASAGALDRSSSIVMA